MKSERKELLIKLQEYMNLETGEIVSDAFDNELLFYVKKAHKCHLDRDIESCVKCPELNVTRLSGSAPGFGSLNAKVILLGSALSREGMLSKLPFASDSTTLVNVAMKLSGVPRYDIFCTNAIHCHIPGRRGATSKEKQNCRGYLKREIDLIDPRVIVALGADAKEALEKLEIKTSKTLRVTKLKDPKAFEYSSPESRVNFVIKLATELEKVL